jgi:hypothetical protein
MTPDDRLKIGDLVQHRTGALGILIEILPSSAEDVYNICWLDSQTLKGTYNSHFERELKAVK